MFIKNSIFEVEKKGRKHMEILIKKVHVLVFFLSLNFYISQEAQAATAKSYCGNIRIEEPFVSQNSTHSSFLKNIVFCRSDILYYTTSIGLFQVSSIDYKNKLLTLSDTSCSTSSHYVSPKDLSFGFPPIHNPNSLLLFNCLYPKGNTSTFQICPYLKKDKDSSFFNLCKEGGSSSCLMVDDVQDLENEFHPKDLNCSHYRRVYKSNSLDEKLELGTRISWDIDHVPNPCDECRKPYGNCGVGLRCLCHVTQCKVEVSAGPILKHCGIMLFSMLCLIVVMDVLKCEPRCI